MKTENEMEMRTQQGLEIRVEPGADGGEKIEGYAALFNVPSQDLGGFREIILPGAFNATLSADVRALWNHNDLYVIGRTTNGTLWLQEDERGLAVVADPPPTQWAEDLKISIRRGDISQMSFQFRVKPGGDEWRQENGQVIRVLKPGGLDLYDVSPVTFPAYLETVASVGASVRKKAEELQAEMLDDLLNRQGPGVDPAVVQARHRIRKMKLNLLKIIGD